MRYFQYNSKKRDSNESNETNGKRLKIIASIDEFRGIPVCPTFEEINDKKDPSIRSNIIKGQYNDVNHYLDIQYRLLREDFVRPLRRGINEYKENIKCGKRVDKIQDIEVYESVKIGKLCEKSLFSYWATFETKNLSHIDWKSSDRLFFGGLVCLSSDNFKSFRFGSITGNRTIENLINGIFQLKFESPLLAEGLTTLDILSSTDLTSSSYVMIESNAYFEAYRYTLLALQRFTSDNFPLKQYLIDVNTEVSSPSYITSQTTFDLSHMIVGSQPLQHSSTREVIVIDDSNSYSCFENIVELDPQNYRSIKIMDSTQWPTAEAMALDRAQYVAFKSALTKQIVVIQGPPGTGKTYLGLKIVQTLYANRFISRYYKSKPILIVCYTNHALDQFLEGMLPFCKNLIRIGGGSKSEEIKKYTLRQGRKSNEKQIYTKDIIGMTTTGAAKFRHILETIDPKIVVIEEAAEVLESHVITSLTKGTEQLILIGDHQQLRPQTADYEMSKEHNLNISLFERMINNGMPFNRLTLQHRMRPEISGLLTPHIYEMLFNHKSVHEYEDIRGVKKNMFFINHSKNESSNDQRMSKSNRFEAEFIVRLCKHLLYQNYESSKITILTLYSSQFYLIQKLLREDEFYEGVKCEVLDSFQGEENDIILVSFVRSNLNNDIGFLKISNRINVALSRAKKGLYCVGNFDCLSEKCLLWDNICNYLNGIQAIGPALELNCPNHPNKVISVSNVRDFDKFPFGGCSEPCVASLECGHPCPYKSCHPLDHKQLKCKSKCLKINCGLNHLCQRLCHFPNGCNECLTMIEKTVPKCGHSVVITCSGDLICSKPCERPLECGHICHNKCGEDCQLICRERVKKTIDKCGHKIKVECFQTQLICLIECENWLNCGHKCKEKCFRECKEKCEDCMAVSENRSQPMDVSDEWISD